MKLYTVEDVAGMLHRSKGTIYNWIHNGTHLGPKFKKIGAKPMISESDLEQYYKDQK
jgi:excisionase family DNA binding protein